MVCHGPSQVAVNLRLALASLRNHWFLSVSSVFISGEIFSFSVALVSLVG